jgi:hypothetical protein
LAENGQGFLDVALPFGAAELRFQLPYPDLQRGSRPAFPAEDLGLPIGNLLPVLMQKLNDCLKVALELR